MIAYDLLQETYSALLSNKVRSGLTVLGIVIGIGSVIAMIAIGAGAQSMIQSNIQSLGSNLIIVMPGAQRGPGVQVSSGRGSAQSLTVDDAEAIQKEISTIKALAPEVSRRYQVTARGANTNTQVIGTNDFYPSVRSIEIGEGSFITEQNIRTAAKIAVLGPTARDDLFGEGANPIGQTIRIQRVDFKVIGVTKSKGGSGFNNPDDAIFIPFSSAQRFLSGNEYLTSISVQASSEEAMQDIQNQITALLLEIGRAHV